MRIGRLPLALACALSLMACSEQPPEAEGTALKLAVFNVHLARQKSGKLIAELEVGSPQLSAVTRVIAHADPDILVIQELDYDAEGRALALFKQRLAQAGAAYAYAFHAPVNTGRRTGLDLTGNGKISDPEDAQGWGLFEGQFGMAVLSRVPIKERAFRSFRKMLWADMPGSLYPEGYYPEQARRLLRLSSKSHWDLPIHWRGRQIHLLISHPTPPVFDGPEDRNGRRNADENRFWAEYLNGAEWITDDEGGRGGLETGASAIVMGDLNADPNDGDGREGAISVLLEHPRLQDPQPRNSRAPNEVAALRGVNAQHTGDLALVTADWKDEGKGASGDLRVDYVLPTRDISVTASGVLWPPQDHALRKTVEQASDHRLVWIEIE